MICEVNILEHFYSTKNVFKFKITKKICLQNSINLHFIINIGTEKILENFTTFKSFA